MDGKRRPAHYALCPKLLASLCAVDFTVNEQTSYNGWQRSAYGNFGHRIADCGFGLFNPRSRVPSGCRNPQCCCALFRALAVWLIVASRAVAGDAGSTDAFRVFDCKFDQQWDEDFDGWPDRWVRR